MSLRPSGIFLSLEKSSNNIHDYNSDVFWNYTWKSAQRRALCTTITDVNLSSLDLFQRLKQSVDNTDKLTFVIFLLTRMTFIIIYHLDKFLISHCQLISNLSIIHK